MSAPSGLCLPLGCDGCCDADGASGAEKKPPYIPKIRVSWHAQLLLLQISSSFLKAGPEVAAFPLPQKLEVQ